MYSNERPEDCVRHARDVLEEEDELSAATAHDWILEEGARKHFKIDTTLMDRYTLARAVLMEAF